MRALGPAAAATLFMTLGGTTIYIPERTRRSSRLSEAVETDGVTALLREFGSGHLKVPMAKAWLARHLDGQGVSRSEIAHRLRITRESLRGHLAGGRRGTAQDGDLI